MDEVNSTIQNINQGAGNIAHAVKEQVQATNEISRNIAEVTQRTTEISAGIKLASSK